MYGLIEISSIYNIIFYCLCHIYLLFPYVLCIIIKRVEQYVPKQRDVIYDTKSDHKRLRGYRRKCTKIDKYSKLVSLLRSISRIELFNF